MNSKKSLGRKILCVMFFSILLCSSFSAFAQAPKGNHVAANKAAAKCSGAWTGSITYTRTQSQSSSKKVERVSARGYDTTDFHMNYDYKARVAVIDSPENNGTSVARATINHSMSSTETVVGVEKNSCDRGKSWRDMSGTSTSKTEMTGGEGGVEANVSVGVNADGTYSVSVGVPEIKGKVAGSTSSTFSGQCTPKEGRNFSMPATETNLDGHSLTSDGTTRVNPGDPNRLSGSYSLTTPGNVTETITWNLQKCGAPLRITDLKFQDMKFPNWDEWKEIVEQTGTTDGNWVKITARVLNASGETKEGEVSFKETFKGDKWDGAKPDMPLKDDMSYVRLEPGEERDVEVLWDSTGYAWYDDGRPRLVERVKAEVWENNKLQDDMTKNLKVAPKPVVLVHGIWASWKTFETWQNILTVSHSYDWKAFPVGEKPEKGVLNTGGEFLSTTPSSSVAENAAQLKSYVRYAQEDRNAWHVDVVAHSTGGLIARNYISQMMPPNTPDARPQIEHLVMLGTPNQGSPCADVMYLLSGLKVLYQATQDFTAGFNRLNMSRKGVKFSSLAGNPLPTMCKSIVWNDGFVPVPSAIWNIADSGQSKSIHTDLTGTSDFSSFVKPHLAIGPRGDHNPSGPDLPQVGGVARNYGKAFATGGIAFDQNAFETISDGDTAKGFSKELNIAPHQSVDLEIPVETGLNFGITFMADPSISATLVDEHGRQAGRNAAGSPEARGWFRSIFVDCPTTAGTWKLKLENTGDREYRAVLITWSK